MNNDGRDEWEVSCTVMVGPHYRGTRFLIEVKYMGRGQAAAFIFNSFHSQKNKFILAKKLFLGKKENLSSKLILNTCLY